jgi:hypothetical protein
VPPGQAAAPAKRGHYRPAPQRQNLPAPLSENDQPVAADQRRPDQAADWLPQPGQQRWIFVDFQDPRLGGREPLLRHLLTEMEIPIPDPCQLEDFLDAVSDHLHQPTVILLDEIGVALERYPDLDDAFWESLRSLATNQVGGNLGLSWPVPNHPPTGPAQRLRLPFLQYFWLHGHARPL